MEHSIRPGFRFVPHLITLTSLMLGVVVVYIAFSAVDYTSLQIGAYLLLMAMVCDILDGRVARAVGCSGAFGKELDSLADLVSFGVAPAALYWAHGLQGFGLAGIMIAFLFVAGAAVRLARFNVQSSLSPLHFEGLPVTISAAAVVGLVLLKLVPYDPLSYSFYLLLPALFASLMTSTIRFRTLKQMPMRLLFGIGMALFCFPGLVILYFGGLGLLISIICLTYILWGIGESIIAARRLDALA